MTDKWISVKDKLPETSDKQVLIYDGENIFLAYFYLSKNLPPPPTTHTPKPWKSQELIIDGEAVIIGYFEFIDNPCSHYLKESDHKERYITHWMPLPEPPEENK